jgi:hypothetical protein
VAAAGVAAIAALEMIGRGEDEIRSLEVVVFRFECRRRGDVQIAVHSPIFSRTRGLSEKRPEAMGRIEV